VTRTAEIVEEVERDEVRRRLPRGSHGIPADVVARNQRERLVAAMAEICAERGYAEVSVAAVAKRAGVSSVTFYKQFAGKQDCLLAAHQQLLGRLFEEVDGAREAEIEEEARTRAAVRAALALLAVDAPSARLLTVEILAAGSEGSKCHETMVEAFAKRLGSRTDSLPSPADWARTAGILALIGNRVMTGEAASLPGLEDELVATLSSQS
jgi:AcrR family transcriptional regulator